MILAIAAGNDDVVKILLEDARTDPSVSDNNPIALASVYGRTNILKMLPVDPTTNDNLAIRAGFEPDWRLGIYTGGSSSVEVPLDIKSHLGVIRLLLADPRVDLYFDDVIQKK